MSRRVLAQTCTRFLKVEWKFSFRSPSISPSIITQIGTVSLIRRGVEYGLQPAVHGSKGPHNPASSALVSDRHNGDAIINRKRTLRHSINSRGRGYLYWVLCLLHSDWIMCTCAYMT